jgi:hypothetical protein
MPDLIPFFEPFWALYLFGKDIFSAFLEPLRIRAQIVWCVKVMVMCGVVMFKSWAGGEETMPPYKIKCTS